MTRAGLAAVALLALACERPPPAAAPAELRLTLPDGWRVVPGKAGLTAGPPERTVLFLESTKRPFPAPDAFAAAVEAEGASGLEKESSELFLGLTYLVDARPAFLGVSRVGARTVWCSTAAGATAEDVGLARGVCRSLSLKGDAP